MSVHTLSVVALALHSGGLLVAQQTPAPVRVIAPAGQRLQTVVKRQTSAGTNATIPAGSTVETNNIINLSGSAPTNATGATPTIENKRLAEILKLTYDRRPTNVLRMMARKATDVPAFTNDIERFQADVITSDWPAVKKFLAALPEKDAVQVFKSLLAALARTAPLQNIAQPNVEMAEQMVSPPAARPSDAVLLPENIIGLADARPGVLTDSELDALGKLLGRALTKGAPIEPFVATLDAGTDQLGGNDAKKRQAAATLLIAAGRLTDAAAFLPGFDAGPGEKDFVTLDRRARLLMAEGVEKQDPTALRGSWDLTRMILADKAAAGTNREIALQRAVELMPLLSKELGRDWMREMFGKNSGQGMSILAAVGSVVSQGAAERDSEKRRRNLELQRRVVDELLAAVGPDTDPWQGALTVVTLGWLQEAEQAKARHRPRTMNQQIIDFDSFGNPIYTYASYDGPMYNAGSAGAPALTIDNIIPTAPGEAWLNAIDKGVQLRVRAMMAGLFIALEQEEKAVPWIEGLASGQPRAALSLANDLLRSWAQTKDPNRDSRRNMRIYSSPYGNSYSQGIPITRAVQVRNLQQLTEVLARLRPVGALDEKAVVSAFAASHSQAEVFRVADVEKVLGSPDALKVETLAELLQAMRERLARQWRAPAVQQQAKTKRTDKDIAREVNRGYELVLELTEHAVTKRPNEWRLWTVRGATWFDWAEYQYGKDVALAVYTGKRDKAFEMFEKAARLYAGQVPAMNEKDQTALVYQQWFNATLGASDLAFLTRQQKIDTNRIDQIRDALMALSSEAAERHAGMFGRALVDAITALPPELKPRYLKAGLRLVGDHESAEPARKLVAYYDGLLQEVEFSVRVDGNTTVGHGRPFGMHLCIRHSDAVGRESGGFSKYLQNQQAMQYYYNPYGGTPVNYRDDFEKKVRETLHDGFEILSITWHDEKIEPRGYGRPEWRETPIAYVLLQARDAATDRVPSMQLDLDFLDKRGKVVLPIESPVVLIDARPDKPPARALVKLSLTEILDDRDAKSGKLALEIKATGHGIIPDLADLVTLQLPGLTVQKTNDHGLALNKLDIEGDSIAPVCERSWVLDLVRADRSSAPAAFQFPRPAVPTEEIAYKHYSDADLVSVHETLALAGMPLQPANPWRWVVTGGLLLVCGAGLWALLRPVPGAAALAPAVYNLPAHVTPFSVLGLLRAIEQDARLRLPEDLRSELSRAILELERRHFGPGADADGQADLERLAQSWIGRAS
ncbi:MAG: hypothetical protein QOF48_3810 [Verrucomicrobiota bacterium]